MRILLVDLVLDSTLRGNPWLSKDFRKFVTHTVKRALLRNPNLRIWKGLHKQFPVNIHNAKHSQRVPLHHFPRLPPIASASVARVHHVFTQRVIVLVQVSCAAMRAIQRRKSSPSAKSGFRRFEARVSTNATRLEPRVDGLINSGLCASVSMGSAARLHHCRCLLRSRSPKHRPNTQATPLGGCPQHCFKRMGSQEEAAPLCFVVPWPGCLEILTGSR